MTIFPIEVSSRTFLPERAGAVETTVADGETEAAAAVTAGAGVLVTAVVLADEADWVHPAQSTSAATRSPAINNNRTCDIPMMMGVRRKKRLRG